MIQASEITVTGTQLREIRTRYRYKQHEFARMFGVHKQTICDWERGVPRYNLPRSVQILAYLLDKSHEIRDEVEKIAGLK